MRQGLGTRSAALAIALALAAAVAACGGDDGTGGTAKPAADQAKAGRTAPKPAPRARRREKAHRAARKRKRKRRVVVVKAPKVGATTKPERATGFPKDKSWRAPKQVASFDACMRRAQSYEAGKRCYDQFQQATGGKGISSREQIPKPGPRPGD